MMPAGNSCREGIAMARGVTASPRGEASRDAILQAAVRVIGREGLSGASLAAVAAEAGTSKPAVLYHFGSRERLLRQVAALAVSTFRRLLDSAAEEGTTPRKLTLASVAKLFEPEHRALLVCLHELLGLGMRDPEVGRLMLRSLEETAEGPAQSLARLHGAHAMDLARALVMSVQGHLEFFLCSGATDPTPFVESATRTALAIARPAPAP
jgi:AcrR family transcriptional regulator